MALISPTNMKIMTDKLGRAWAVAAGSIGLTADQLVPEPGTVQDKIEDISTLITTTSDDIDQHNDLENIFRNCLDETNVEAFFVAKLKKGFDAINTHCKNRGKTVSADIVDLDSYLVYYNGGGGGIRYSCLCTPEFGVAWESVMGAALPPVGLMSKAVHPTFNPDASVNGLGAVNVDAEGLFDALAYQDGDEIDEDSSERVNVNLEVVTSFESGITTPTVDIKGLDGIGVLVTYATVSLGASNPTAAISTTITPVCTGNIEQTVAVASLTGIVAGSVLTVNSGLIDEEVITVKSIDSGATTLTAVFQKTHQAGAAITGKRTFAVTIGYRIKDVTDMVLNIGSHDAGKVRVVGIQDRVAV